jgi:non-ribosomal peptide synthetase component F
LARPVGGRLAYSGITGQPSSAGLADVQRIALSRDYLPRFFVSQLADYRPTRGGKPGNDIAGGVQNAAIPLYGQEDILVGVPVAIPGQEGTAGVIGPLENTLVVRSDLTGKPTFRAFLGRVRETTAAAEAHQVLPFAALVSGLQPARNLSHPPVFQVAFDYQEAERPILQAAGLSLYPLEPDPAVSRYDLSLRLTRQGNELSGTLEYNTDLFEAATIERMVGHYRTLLEGIAADPERPLSDLLFLTESERQQLLVTWNETAADFPSAASIHSLFEAQVERTPDAPALLFEGERLSYGELNRRANQLAHRLKKLGIGPEVPAGVFVERSTEMVVALLAILKAGGFYVPLDPVYPPERVAFMLADSQAPVILTQAALRGRLPEHEAEVFAWTRIGIAWPTNRRKTRPAGRGQKTWPT